MVRRRSRSWLLLLGPGRIAGLGRSMYLGGISISGAVCARDEHLLVGGRI
jgi:hypothetical protein